MTIENFVETQIVHNQYRRLQGVTLITPEVFEDTMERIPEAKLYEGNIKDPGKNSGVFVIYHFENGLNGSSLIYSFNNETNHEIIMLIGLKHQRERLKTLLESQSLKLVT